MKTLIEEIEKMTLETKERIKISEKLLEELK